ncbi:MAG TPA: TonB family protein [Gammaproteobacteria bacterium]
MAHKPVFVEGIFTLRNLRSVGTAAIVEILITAAIAAILILRQLAPVPQAQLAPGPVVEFSPQPQPLPHSVPMRTPQRPQQPRLAEVPSVPTDIPGPNVQPVQPPSQPAPQSQASATLLNEFGARMLQAINAQKVYPKTAILKGQGGEATVSFDYVDGVVSNIHVDSSSGFPELDAAAVQAVQNAALPAKPAELAGLNHFVFELAFNVGL